MIDALLKTKERIDDYVEHKCAVRSTINCRSMGDNRQIILVTAHRRENFDGGMERDRVLASGCWRNATTSLIVFPVHPNPNVLEPMQAMLGDHPRIRLLPPLEYLPFVYLLSRCHIVLTDSGGVQEEAPALGKPVLVMRDTTERPEGVEAGTALLVGTDPQRIATEAMRLLRRPAALHCA